MRLKQYCALISGLVFAVSAIGFSSCGTAPSSGTPSGASSGASSARTQTSAEHNRRQQIYMDFLRNEGYMPSIDEDGDVLFKKDGRSYYILSNSDDYTYICLLFPNIWSINSDVERAQVANVISYANRRTKVAKLYMSGSRNQYVSIAVETYHEDPSHFGILFSRMMSALSTAENNFRDNL